MIKYKEKIANIIPKKEKGLKRRKDGSIIWKDIVQADFPIREQEWVLDFKESDIPDILKMIFKISNINGRKSFVVRDFYKMLVKDNYYFLITSEQKWWFDILMDKNIQILKNLTLGKPYLAKFFANLLAILTAKEIKGISETLALKKNFENFNERFEKIKEKIKEMTNFLSKDAGYGTDWSWKLSSAKKINIPYNIFEKIKGIGFKIRGYFYSLEKNQDVNFYPKNSDYSLAEDILFLDKISKGFTDLENRTKNLKVDLYLDTSGSMQGDKLLFLKGVVKELKRAGIRFRKIYAFCAKLLRIKEKDIWNMNAMGGTNIEAALKNVQKNSFYSVIISDMEDKVEQFIETLKKVESKISLIQIGDKETYEKWKNYVGIAYFIEI